MLIRHTALYSLARGLPGLINFGALALYTRLLAPADYGTYALVVAWVGISNAVAFQWLRSAARRFLPAAIKGNASELLQSISAAYLAMLPPTALGAVIVASLVPSRPLDALVFLGLGLLWLQAFFELSLELVLAGLRPQRYGVVAAIRATLAASAGGLLAYFGFGTMGVLAGISFGLLVSILLMIRSEWRGVIPSFRHRETLSALARYGLPLSVTFILEYVINSSDRVLLGQMIGPEAVGTYAVAYDLSQQGLFALMLVVYLAGFPLAVRALETGGTGAAQRQLHRHATLLGMIAIPAAAGLALLAGNVAQVMLGVEFRQEAATLIPLIAAAGLLAGAKAYYFDLAFQLGHATMAQVWIGAVVAVLNVGLNLAWIPRYGALGAAYSTLLAFAVAIVLSAWFGRRAFPMPVPFGQWLRVLGATLGMVAVVLPITGQRGALALVLQLLAGVAAYALGAVALNVAGSRTIALGWLRR